MPDRREFMKSGAFMAGLASVAALVPEAVQRAYAITPEPGTSWLDAEHIVILMQENRSFDHMFGTLRGVRGFNDPRMLRQADGTPLAIQRDKAGTGYLPWRMNIKDSRITWMGSTDHMRHSQIDAWNGGLQNNWIEAKRPRQKEYRDIPITMGYFTREDIPFYYALADAFTICDQSYCSILSSTTPNRLMLWSGTLREERDTGALFYISNEWTHAGGLDWMTFPERLQKAGVSWKCYQNSLYSEGPFFKKPEDLWLGNFGDNPLERFASYPIGSSPAYREYVDSLTARLIANVTKREGALKREHDAAAAGSAEAAALQRTLQSYAEQKRRLASKRTAMARPLDDLTPEERNLRARGFAINDGDPDYLALETLSMTIAGRPETMSAPKGDVLHQFREDVRAGTLPTVSWLIAAGNLSDHPSRPWYGAWYVSEVMNILTEDPEVWKKTIFILAYDENDGFFDHAPPFVAADPKRPETGGASAGIDTAPEYMYKEDMLIQGCPEGAAREGPVGLGYRVPMIIASPWTRGGWVNSQVSDHTSVIRLIEAFIEGKYGKQIRETNISDWRRAACGDLTSVFREYEDEATTLPFLERDSFLETIESAKDKPLPTGWRTLDRWEISRLAQQPDALRAALWQEPGIRPACALPYELYADGEIDPRSRSFRLTLRAGNRAFGARASGAPFNVYLYETKIGSEDFEIEGMAARMAMASYAVRAGDRIDEEIDLSRFASDRYDIVVHGPNGFYRRFTGHADGPAIGLAAGYHAPLDVIEFSLINRSKTPCDVIVEDLSYGAPSRSLRLASSKSGKQRVDLSGSHGWYDLGVRLKGDRSFLRRYAGHVETGRRSQSDPLMGKSPDHRART